MREKGQRTLAIWALVIALCATSVAYAILQTALTISGSVTKKGGTWDIQFVEVGWVAGEELTTEPAVSGTNLNFGVTLNEPNDYVVIRFKVKNNGSINAIVADNNVHNLTVGTSTSTATYAEDWSANIYQGISCIVSHSPDINVDSDGLTASSEIYGNLYFLNANTTSQYIYLKCRYNDVDSSEELTSATVSVTYRMNYAQA